MLPGTTEKAHAKLRESENKFRTLFDRSFDAVLLGNSRGVVVDADITPPIGAGPMPAVADDEDTGRLLAATIAAGGVSGFEGG